MDVLVVSLRYSDLSVPLWSIRFYVADGGVFRSQAALHTPPGAQAGASVALTVTVGALDSADSNSAVVYLTVVPPVSVHLAVDFLSRCVFS